MTRRHIEDFAHLCMDAESIRHVQDAIFAARLARDKRVPAPHPKFSEAIREGAFTIDHPAYADEDLEIRE